MEETSVEIHHPFDEIFRLYEISRAEQRNCKDDGDKINNLYFETVLAHIDKLLLAADVDKSSQDYVKLLAMKACLYYEQGKILLVREQTEFALETMKNALMLIQQHKLHPLITYLHYRIINYHVYYLSRTDCLEEAKHILEDAEQLYYALSNKPAMFIYSTDELFRHSEPKHPHKLEKFEKLVTNNLQLQGWIYSKFGQMDKFFIYHHRVLNRHLECQDSDTITWVTKCARLASHFIDSNRFSEARYHLAAACGVLRECERELDSFQRSVDMGHVRRAYADLGKQWVKYGLRLFELSGRKVTTPDEAIDRLLITSFDNVSSNVVVRSAYEPSSSSIQPIDCVDTIDNYTFVFPTLFVADIESQVTDAPFTTTDEARKVFLYVQEWLKRAKSFYTLRAYPTEHVDLVFELSELYRFLATYESDLDSQYNVQKRRSDILDTLYNMLRDVQPVNYTSSCMEVFRELTQIHIELIFFNLKRLTTATNTTSGVHMQHQLEAVKSIHDKLGEYVKCQRRTKVDTATRAQTTVTATNTHIVVDASNEQPVVASNEQSVVASNEQPVVASNEQSVGASNEQSVLDVTNEQSVLDVINEQSVLDVTNEQPVEAASNVQIVDVTNEQPVDSETIDTTNKPKDATNEQLVSAIE